MEFLVIHLEVQLEMEDQVVHLLFQQLHQRVVEVVQKEYLVVLLMV